MFVCFFYYRLEANILWHGFKKHSSDPLSLCSHPHGQLASGVCESCGCTVTWVWETGSEISLPTLGCSRWFPEGYIGEILGNKNQARGGVEGWCRGEPSRTCVILSLGNPLICIPDTPFHTLSNMSPKCKTCDIRSIELDRLPHPFHCPLVPEP